MSTDAAFQARSVKQGSDFEWLDLMEHEKVIEQGLAGFVEVGTALLAIRDGKKYRHAGYTTFEDYCQQRWQMSKQHGGRLMSAATIVADLKMEPMGSISPESERQVRPLGAVKPDERAQVWAEAVEAADGGQPTAKQVAEVVTKRQPPKKDHPATFSDPILAEIAERLPTAGVVLDPFAGTGRIHELATADRKTIGVEIQPQWADKHPDTMVGNALALDIADGSVDAVATSPTYGNRMADHHNATDDSVRLTYTHTHGSPLEPDNSGTLQWGDEYREFHRKAWREAVRVLRPGGTLTINVKNHVRAGEVQRVVEWHIDTLVSEFQLGFEIIEPIPTRGLAAGANSDVRTNYEYVLTFRKKDAS